MRCVSTEATTSRASSDLAALLLCPAVEWDGGGGMLLSLFVVVVVGGGGGGGGGPLGSSLSLVEVLVGRTFPQREQPRTGCDLSDVAGGFAHQPPTRWGQCGLPVPVLATVVVLYSLYLYWTETIAAGASHPQLSRAKCQLRISHPRVGHQSNPRLRLWIWRDS